MRRNRRNRRTGPDYVILAVALFLALFGGSVATVMVMNYPNGVLPTEVRQALELLIACGALICLAGLYIAAHTLFERN